VQPTTGQARPRKPGRPRNEQADAAIFDTTLHMLVDTMSVDSVSIEAVAARAGVAKTTVYRRWPNKIALIVDAVRQLQPALPEHLPGTSVRADLLAILESLQQFRDRSLAGRLLLCMMVEQQRHPELLEQYYAQVVQPRRAQIRGVLTRAIASGQLRPDADVDAVMQCLTAVLTRLKLESDGLSDAEIEQTVDLILNGVAARPAPPG
jgi:AcrR family transcriptional regulator